MPAIILSDNGASSGSAGLKTSGSNDGTLALQTSTAGGTATTAVTINTSQNVGIGTTSPGAKLSLTSTGNTTADGIRLTFGSEARAHNIYSALPTGRDLTIAPYRALTINTGSGTTEGVLTLNAYEYTVFGTGSSYTERMRLDASGNLGLGAAPSAWLNSWRALTLGGTSGIGGAVYSNAGAANAQQIGIAANWYYAQASSTNVRIGAGYATDYYQYNGTHVWSTAASSTAGSTVSFTQVMTLDASGRLGVGTTSPSSPLHVSYDSEGLLRLNRATTTTGAAFIVMTNGGGNYYIGPDSSAGNRGFASGGAAYGLVMTTESANPVLFGTNNIERARIDTSGNLLVNATSPAFASGGTTYTVKFAVDATNQTNGAYFKYNSTGAFVTLNNTFGSGTRPYISFDNGNTRAGDVSYNGSVMTYGGTSDYRLKENVQPIQNGLSRVMQMNPVSYTWKHNGMASEGFLAHEIQAISPDAVSGEKDAVDQNGNPQYQQVDPRHLVCILTAAIQEQQAIIAQLQADVATLKGQP